jgi:putative PEP-CTERM system TPR-repeat lipoprotein
MSLLQRRNAWRRVAFAIAICAVGYPAAAAKDTGSVKEAEQNLKDEDPNTALITLKNAIRKSPQDPAIRVKIARVYLRLGDASSAEREARTARDLNGDEADYLPVLIDALLSQKKFKDLYDLIEPGDRDPVLESRIRTALGIAAVRLGYDTRAEALLRDAIRLDPGNVEPRTELARFLNGTRPEEADRVIDEAVAANPQSAQLLQAKGEIQWSRGDPAGAVRLFDEALKIDPKYQVARLSRANANVLRGEFAAADEDLDAILQAVPNNFGANYLRGLEQVKQGQFVAADRTLDSISSAFPAFAAGYFLQGVTKLGLGQLNVGEGILKKYLALVPGNPEATRLMATAALQQHDPSRAIDYLNPLVEKLPPDPTTLTLLGNAYMADRKPELALQQFEKAAALDPDNAMTKTRVAVAEIRAGKSREGLEQLEQVFNGQADPAIAGPTLVLAELRAGRIDKAAEVAASLIRQDADNPLYQVLLGEVRVAQRDDEGAKTEFYAALTKNPEFAAAARDLALLYIRSGRTDDARKVYSDLLAKKPADTTALLGLADIAIAEKRWPETVDLLNQARAASKFDPTAGLKLIQLDEQRGDWNSAKAVAAELYALFPRDVNVAVALGRARLGAGDTNAAISAYKLAHQLAPGSTPIRSSYVALLKQAKFFREAFDALQEAVIREPQNASLKAELIRVDAEVDGVDGAVSRAREFAASDAGNSIYDLVSAELYEKAGRVADAAALLEKALAVRPADDGLAVDLSRLYARTGDFGKAESLLTARLRTDQNNIAASSALAPLYLMTGRPSDAKKAYGDVLSQKPDDIPALIGLADIAVGERQWPDAIDYAKRARHAAPNDPSPGIRLVNLYGLRRDWKNATATVAELADKFATNVDVLDVQARVQFAAGDVDGAVSTYQRAHEIAPDSLPILSSYVDLLRAAKKSSEARTVLQAAVDRNRREGSLKGELIRVEAEIGDLGAGLSLARDFAKNDPDNSLYDRVSAEIYERAGRGEDAAGLLEKAIAARPSDTDLTIALARLYRRTGLPAKAEAVLKARLKVDPKDSDARMDLAMLYSAQKRDAAAIAEYSNLIDIRPTDPVLLNNLAWLYHRQGEPAKARELAERALALAPNDARIDDTLGWILLGEGENDRAMAYLNSASLVAPGDPGIQYHRAVALQRIGRASDAREVLETLLGSSGSFAEKAEAEKLLQELKRG